MPTTYAIPDGRTVMAATLYTGTGATQSITNTVNGVSMQPDLVWMKARSSALSNTLTDAVRGVSTQLFSNLTNAETTEAGKGLTAFNSNGFTLGPDLVGTGSVNANTVTYVGWQWNAGGSTVTNTSGSISAQVRANPTAGFSVVTYTGTGANATVGHGLGVAPSMILVKNRTSGTVGGAVYHTSLGATKYLKLFQTTTGTAVATTDNTAWNGASPTFNTSVFSIGSLDRTNSSTTMVAYCFAAVAGYSAFGSYTGNNLADGPFVYLGFRPRWIMFKDSSSIAVWMIMDTARNTINVLDDGLAPDNSNAESTYSNVAQVDFLSNGFKIRATNANQYWANVSGNTYIYAAFAENPFKYANAV